MKASTADRRGREAKRKNNSLGVTWKALRGRNCYIDIVRADTSRGVIGLAQQ